MNIVKANLTDSHHQASLMEMVEAFSADFFGANRPLTTPVREELIDGLRAHPTTLVFLAFESASPIGMAICFRTFSTFAARPSINIHDFFVSEKARSRGISRELLEAVEAEARASGCCKLTLEVLAQNERARSIYHAAGFSHAAADKSPGGTLFYTRSL
ncbi:MAG: GNAT family N-acetyltransferase [Myxococcota bacterium]|nr:GNAT family N-acetyltransferase [Myxococcota bacterium]